MVSRITASLPAIVTSLMMITTAGTAFAGNSDRFDRHHGHQTKNHHRYGHSDRNRSQDRPRFNPGIIVGGGSVSVLPGIGTYSGSIGAYHVRGNGTYSGVGRNMPRVVKAAAPKARIIVVSEQGSKACSFEAGVCVIRP